MLFRRGEALPVHEFHHWDTTANGDAFTARKADGRSWPCGFANEHFYAGFPHLYWAGTSLPRRFVTAARSYDFIKAEPMTEPELNQLLSTITPPDEAARAAAHAHWASLAKPLGGLGALETLLEEAAALTGTAQRFFPPGRAGALRRQRRGGPGRQPDRQQRDPRRG